MTKAWRAAVLQSVMVGGAVAAASRAAEYTCTKALAVCGGGVQDLIGMSIAGLTAGVLYFLLRYQQLERIRLLRERERAMRHIHHHIRNSLQVVVYRCQNDPIVIEQVNRILREVQYALPGKDKYMPEDLADSEDVSTPKA
jgi:two-component sensor histidine kinase